MVKVIQHEHIPSYVRDVLSHLVACGYQAFIVGGAPRDMLLGIEPHDWDAATDASPGQVKACLAGHYELRDQGEKHGTITAMGQSDGHHWQVEVTTFRTEGPYSDGRRPDQVEFVISIEQDLARRDFTVNAIAIRWPTLEIVDPLGGLADLRRKVIRCVGDARARFNEDGLRLLRAIRIRAERGWALERNTRLAMRSQSRMLAKVSKERVRDEFSRILTGRFVREALIDMLDTGLLVEVIPEFAESIGLDQRTRHHKWRLHEHVVETVSRVPPRLVVRLAALLHDIAKPRTFTIDDEGQGHFYGHNKLGAEMAAEILRRLRYDKQTIQSVSTLVREHMFMYGPQVSDAGVRRLIGRVGKDNIADLFELRRADIIASGGLPDPWLDQMWDRVVAAVKGREPLSTLDLAVNGRDVMNVTGWGPGPKVGRVLSAIFERVIERPELNVREQLLSMIKEIASEVEGAASRVEKEDR